MFHKLTQWIEKRKAKRKDNARQQAGARANELYQVCEYKGDLWFTYAGRLVCKTSFFVDSDKMSIVEILTKMRTDYITSAISYGNSSLL